MIMKGEEEKKKDVDLDVDLATLAQQAAGSCAQRKSTEAIPGGGGGGARVGPAHTAARRAGAE